MRILRRKTKIIRIGNVSIGGNNPIAIQSMAKVKTACTEEAIRQIKELKEHGCDIVRLAVKDIQDAKALIKIKKSVSLPIVADIHFDWRLALASIDSGVDKIRLNPGNIYKKEQIREIAKAAKLSGIPIRVGLNSGSLRKLQAPRLSGRQASSKLQAISQMMVSEALNYINILEKFGFYDIVVSLKGSNLLDTIEAYQKMSKLCAYPFHLGVTASGTLSSGTIKSSIAIGALLLEGIGDTIRVSLTAKPCEEVKVARSILEALGLSRYGPEIISCPTCGRCEVDLVKIVQDLENKLNTQYPILNTSPMKIAVMGCVVNGPGEAKEADIGVAFGKKDGLLFKKGKVTRKVSFSDCAGILIKEIKSLVN
ncbi:MAG: flavodoxin-dependent (E)-4-hydroxy-3-methylbut-2-enyl-diphosphate synthase [Candidatus Omnitrophica bacterium]|nr:flavodoxin-dependent (E)-4-hydroxy-3-methylbut-2-enyl-diphosphate synthase [Candidatus Omnitrophota bacterium]